MPIVIANVGELMRLNNFSRQKSGAPGFGYSFEYGDVHAAESAGHFREAIAELDSYLDNCLRQIARSAYQITYEETAKMVKEGVYGERLAKQLFDDGSITASLYNEIIKFKRKRNIVIHSPFSYLALVNPEKEKFTKKNMWEKLARERFSEIKRKGFNIIADLQKVKMKQPLAPD